MNRIRLAVSYFALTSVVAFANVPKGFEDPVVLDKVMKGNIITEQVMATKTEFKSVIRAYFNKTSPSAYTDLFTSHKKWIGLVKEIIDAKTTGANATKTEFTYWLKLKIKYGIFTFNIEPEGKQTVMAGADAISEWKVINDITNYKDQLKQAQETIRLIPYQGGILVEDNIHVILAQESSQAATAKKEIEKKWTELIGAFRDELGGNY